VIVRVKQLGLPIQADLCVLLSLRINSPLAVVSPALLFFFAGPLGKRGKLVPGSDRVSSLVTVDEELLKLTSCGCDLILFSGFRTLRLEPLSF